MLELGREGVGARGGAEEVLELSRGMVERGRISVVDGGAGAREGADDVLEFGGGTVEHGGTREVVDNVGREEGGALIAHEGANGVENTLDSEGVGEDERIVGDGAAEARGAGSRSSAMGSHTPVTEGHCADELLELGRGVVEGADEVLGFGRGKVEREVVDEVGRGLPAGHQRGQGGARAPAGHQRGTMCSGSMTSQGRCPGTDALNRAAPKEGLP